MTGTYSRSLLADLSLSPQRFRLPQRLMAVAGLLAVEIFSIDFARLQLAYRTSFIHVEILGGNGKPAMHALLAFIALLLMFGLHRAKPAFEQISREFTEHLTEQPPLRWDFLAAHFAAMAGCLILFAARFAGKSAFLQGSVLAAWPLGAAGICLAGLAFVPFGIWLGLLRSGGAAWAYASAGVLAMWQITRWSDLIWKPATALTFRLVKTLLHSAVPDLIADPAASTLSSHNFAVQISEQCSGIEGLGMMVVFSASWLWIFRRECRFPRALLLIPAGISILWAFNVLRIAALFLIGNAGAPNVAFGGFHSQAGWIAFNVVALGVSLAAQRVPWFRRATAASAAGYNPTVAYLMPFAAILAAGMVSRAASGTFEWLYPLRVVAAAGAIWYFWPKYKKLDWGFGWVAPAIGAAVFALWIGLDLYFGHTGNGIQTGLASLSAFQKVFWIACRTLGAVITVPIAEELAFRGFLIRRMASADFEAIKTRAFTIPAVLISSVAFGLLHGDRWLAGILAGILYSGAFLWRGRIGDAVVAHAVTNGLIAAWVLFGGAWYLW